MDFFLWLYWVFPFTFPKSMFAKKKKKKSGSMLWGCEPFSVVWLVIILTKFLIKIIHMLSLTKTIVFIISICANPHVHLLFRCSTFWLTCLYLYTVLFPWTRHLSLTLQRKGIWKEAHLALNIVQYQMLQGCFWSFFLNCKSIKFCSELWKICAAQLLSTKWRWKSCRGKSKLN